MEIYNTADFICRGTANANGELSSTVPSAKIIVNQNGVKAEKYSGTIEYTLVNAL